MLSHTVNINVLSIIAEFLRRDVHTGEIPAYGGVAMRSIRSIGRQCGFLVWQFFRYSCATLPIGCYPAYRRPGC